MYIPYALRYIVHLKYYITSHYITIHYNAYYLHTKHSNNRSSMYKKQQPMQTSCGHHQAYVCVVCV